MAVYSFLVNILLLVMILKNIITAHVQNETLAISEGLHLSLDCEVDCLVYHYNWFYIDLPAMNLSDNWRTSQTPADELTNYISTLYGNDSLFDHYSYYWTSKPTNETVMGNVSPNGTLAVESVTLNDEWDYICTSLNSVLRIVKLEVMVPPHTASFTPSPLPTLPGDTHTVTLTSPRSKPAIVDINCRYGEGGGGDVNVTQIINTTNSKEDNRTYRQQWEVQLTVEGDLSSVVQCHYTQHTIDGPREGVLATLRVTPAEAVIRRNDSQLICSTVPQPVISYTYTWQCDKEAVFEDNDTIDMGNTTDTVTCTCVISNGIQNITTTATVDFSKAEKQSSNIAVIAGAGGGGAAIIIIVVVIVVVVCLLRRNKTDDKAKRSDSQDECPYVVSGRAPLAGQNQYNSNDNRPPPQSPLYASTEVAKQGYNNGAMTPLSNVSTDDEGAPTAYGNIQPKVAAVDPAVIYSEPHKQKKQKKGNKNRKSDPIQEYANINNQLTDKQKGQYKQPDGTIYTEVSIDNNPSSAPGGSNSNAAAVNIRRRPDNPPTEYARVDFVKTKGGPGAADEGAAAAAPASPVYAEPTAVAAPPARDSDPPPAPPTKPPRLPQL